LRSAGGVRDVEFRDQRFNGRDRLIDTDPAPITLALWTLHQRDRGRSFLYYRYPVKINDG